MVIKGINKLKRPPPPAAVAAAAPPTRTEQLLEQIRDQLKK
jgi:large-conductance mechanosensitive channel